MKLRILFVLVTATLASAATAQTEQPPTVRYLVAHRGLFRDAPENTLPAFAACLELRLGFELDIRRSKDGHLVCIHDDDVKRTTNGTGKVADFTLAELRRLDAGASFDPVFRGETIPTLAEVFALLKDRLLAHVLIALDFKIEDETVAAEVVALAKKHGILQHVICIGLTIDQPGLRKKLRAADAKTPIAVLAQTDKDLAAALADAHADWIYVRFVPTAEQVQHIHQAGKRVFLAGVTVSGNEPENWRRAAAAGVDGLLTDYPLDCRRAFRGKSIN